MSYELETKKRKFERILETLTDSASPTPRPSSSAGNNSSAISRVTESVVGDLSKRRRVTPNSNAASTASSSKTSLAHHYLPSSRAAFLDRLETFRNVTKWHIPSTEPINASAWSKRGWTCIDTDTVCCGSCKERLYIDLTASHPPSMPSKAESTPQPDPTPDEEDDFAMANELYQSIVRRYQDMIVTAHSPGCPWRKRGCDGSIQRIEGLLNVNAAVSALRTRYESIMSNPDEVPNVAGLPVHNLDDSELSKVAQAESHDLNINALRLAVCGWDRKCEDVVECHHCFRSLGLWLYRGKPSTMDNLDAVESHLEYCPWKSAEAQDTEVMSPKTSEDDATPMKERKPGWLLVYYAVVKDNAKRSANPPLPVTETNTATGSEKPMTPEQREKKMRDLMKRIKDIKKPFSVPSFLKRKDKAKFS